MTGKLSLVLALCFVGSFCVNAQSFESVIQKNRYIDCQDVQYNAHSIIDDFYFREEIDSTYQFLDYWEDKCGKTEPVFRFRNLLDIKTGQFLKDSIDSEWIDNLETYKRRKSGKPILINSYFIWLLDTEIVDNDNLDSLTKEMALNIEPSDIDERLLVDFYSSDEPSFELINQQDPDKSELKYYYDVIYTEVNNLPKFHSALISGFINNYGDLSIFGTRPTLGFILGSKRFRHNYDVILDFRMGPSKNDYMVEYKGNEITHDTYTGIYIGFEYTYDFIQSEKFELGLSPGGGIDFVQLVNAENEYDDDPKYVHSLNLNSGLVFKYYLNDSGRYIGLQARYNWLDYQDIINNNLLGEYLNIRITFGKIGNNYRHHRLERLK